MSEIVITVSAREKEGKIKQLVEASSIVREALRVKGLYSGSDASEPFNLGRGYRFIFVLPKMEVIPP